MIILMGVNISKNTYLKISKTLSEVIMIYIYLYGSIQYHGFLSKIHGGEKINGSKKDIRNYTMDSNNWCNFDRTL